MTSQGDSSPLYLYSLLVATFLGTMGLPHILVRFYTNPDGPAARRTTVSVLTLLGLFYLFPGIYGLLGRAYTPGLYVTGQTDTVVLSVPHAVWPGLPGEVLGGVVAAGAFAAFMSTSSGLLVSIAGTLSYDVWPRMRPRQTIGARARQAHFRIAALVGILIPMALALAAENLDISMLVGWAFALAASTFCPLFLLGIWWNRLTAPGAAAGLMLGGSLATSAIALDLAHVSGGSGSAGRAPGPARGGDRAGGVHHHDPGLAAAAGPRRGHRPGHARPARSRGARVRCHRARPQRPGAGGGRRVVELVRRWRRACSAGATRTSG